MSVLTGARVIKLGITNYWRNRGLSISATLILTLTLFIVLVFILINTILNLTSAEIRSKIDELDITFHDSAAEEQIMTLQQTLAARSDVSEVHYVSKEEALERFQGFKDIQDSTKQVATTDNNPLPRSLEIKASSPDKLGGISDFVSNDPWKEMIRKNTYQYNQETILKLSRFEKGVAATGLTLSIVFVLVSLVVVASTIRLAIFTRREEIEIMRLVGANNVFIRVPFMIEAILYSLAAATITLGVVWVLVDRLGLSLNRFLGGIISLDLPALFVQRLPSLIGIELGLGLGITVLASLLSLQRYLKH